MEFYEANLTSDEIITALIIFHDCYYNTDQNVEDFAVEYYNLTEELLHGRLPKKLEYLVDYEEFLIDAIPRLKNFYKGGEK